MKRQRTGYQKHNGNKPTKEKTKTKYDQRGLLAYALHLLDDLKQRFLFTWIKRGVSRLERPKHSRKTLGKNGGRGLTALT